LLADEGDEVVFGGKRRLAVRTFHNSDRSHKSLITRLRPGAPVFTECQPLMTDL